MKFSWHELEETIKHGLTGDIFFDVGQYLKSHIHELTAYYTVDRYVHRNDDKKREELKTHIKKMIAREIAMKLLDLEIIEFDHEYSFLNETITGYLKILK